MAFNGAGVYNRLYSWVQDAINGIKIRADRMDAEDNGFATGLTTCVTRDGQSPALANLPMGGFKHTGCASATVATDYTTLGQLQNSSLALRFLNLSLAGSVSCFNPSIANVPSNIFMDYNPSVNLGRLQALGPDNATNASFILSVTRADGSNPHSISLSLTGGVNFSTYGTGTIVSDSLGNLTSSSDPSLKTKVSDFREGLTEIIAVASDPKYMGNFHWNEDTGKDTICEYTSFFAHDDFPIKGVVWKDKDQNNTFCDRPIIMALVNAVKELEERLASLENH